MRVIRRLPLLLCVLAVGACGSTRFQSTWRAPSANTVNLQRQSAAAFLITGNEAVRRNFEQSMAEQFTKRGIETLPGYEVLPDGKVTDKDAILTNLHDTNVDLAIFMRINGAHQEVTFVPDAWYYGPYADPFWWRYGRFYGPAYAGPWPPYYDLGYYQTDTIVSVSTMIYSVPDAKLLWAGTSTTINPSKVESLVKDLASATVKKLEKAGMMQASLERTEETRMAG